MAVSFLPGTGKFNPVGLIVPDLQNPFYATLAETLETRIAPHGYDLILEAPTPTCGASPTTCAPSPTGRWMG